MNRKQHYTTFAYPARNQRPHRYAPPARLLLSAVILIAIMALPTDALPASHTQTDQFTASVQLAPQGPIFSRRLPDGNDVLICTNGIYVSKALSEAEYANIVASMGDPDAMDNLLGQHPLLEIRAQDAVVFYSQKQLFAPDLRTPGAPLIHSIYLRNDVVLQVGQIEINAREVFYNFTTNAGIMIDGTLRVVLPEQNVPLYLRADEIRQLDFNNFSADGVKLSNDEFYQPHVWLGAEHANLQMVSDPPGSPPRAQYQLDNVTANLGDLPIFWWPRAVGTGRTADAPIKRVHISNDSRFGTSVETEWHPGWLLGAKDPSGVDAIFRTDYFSKRGPAVGFDTEYIQEQYFGRLRSYLIDDHGKDDLGNFDTRQDIQPPRNTRGRVRFQHRHYLRDNWLASFEIAYQSDPTFLESWERKEFNTEKLPETVMYFKQQRDNWAFDFLNKWHLNDFDYTVTELPTAGFHLAGQDLFGKLTYYHDGYVSHLRERAGDRDVSGFRFYEPSILPDALDQRDFAFAVSRHEVALPLHFADLHFAPTAIGVYSYDDSQPDHSVLHGAVGVRVGTQLSHVDNSVKSRFWDLDRIRHVIIPEVSLFWTDSDRPRHTDRNVFNLALRQRWQTMRGPAQDRYSVDWLRWDTSVTLVNNDADDSDLPNHFYFTRPETNFDHSPLINPDLSNLGLSRRRVVNQNQADHVESDWTWLISDKTTLTGQVNYNIHDGVLNEAETAFAVQRTPRTSYYFGDRYLRRGDTFRDDDAHFLTAAASYKVNRKYTLAASHQYDITQTADSYSQLVIIRKLPHWFAAFSLSVDANNDNISFQISFWPEGFDKVAIGSRRFTRLTR